MKKKEVRTLSSRYCPQLEDHVVVMTEKDENGFTASTCLSSHLCPEHQKKGCQQNGGKGSVTM